MADNEDRLLGIERRLTDLQKDFHSILWSHEKIKREIENIAKSLIKIEDRILASK